MYTFTKIKDNEVMRKEYRGMTIFAIELDMQGYTSVTAQWNENGGKFGKLEPKEKIYNTNNLEVAINTYIKRYLDDFINDAIKDIDINKEAYLRDNYSVSKLFHTIDELMEDLSKEKEE